MNTTIKTVLGLAVGLLVLAAWLYFVGFQDTLATLKTVAPIPAIVATLAWVVSFGLRSWKWHIILLSTQRMPSHVCAPRLCTGGVYDVPFAISGRVYWVSSFLNVLFPFRVGELARSLFLKRLVGMPISASLPTILVDRLYSIAVILLGLLFLPLAPFQIDAQTVGAGSSHTSPFGTWSIRWGLGIVAAGFLATLVLLFLLRYQKAHLLHLARHLLSFLPDKWGERLLAFLDATVDSLQLVRADVKSILSLLAWSVAVLLADALKDHFVLQAFGLDVPLPTCFLGVCLTNLAFILPSPPGNIGSNEWYATLVYTTGFGYNGAQVAGGALFGHAMTTLVVVAGGALSLSSLGINLAEGLSISQRDPAQETEV